DVPAHTVFLITTDGMENASSRYDLATVKAMIARQQEKYGWEFVFLAANIDAAETAEGLGISRSRSANYDPLLQKSGVQEMSDRDAYYYFRIDEVRRAGEPAPLEQLRMTIRRILFNGRQQQVIRDHEEELYKNSLEAGLVRLYGGDEENGDNE
ncbi:MAG: hypothetical protein IIW89_00545, partial [Alistipes sp.]|nr:hypothetical protein [Alistipes sp.]